MSPLSAAIPDDFRTALSGAWPALGVLAFRAALGVALGVVLLTTAYASGQIGAALSGATHTPTLGFFHLGALLVTATLVALAQAAISTRLTLTMERRLRARMMAHLHAAPLAAITSRDTGDLLTRLDQDTDVLVGFATASLPAVGPHALMGVGALSLMFDADPLLAGIAAAGVAALLLITRLAARTLRPLAGEQAESLSQATQRARALIQFAPITKAYGGEHAANRAYNLALERVEMASRRMAIYSLSLQPVAWLLAGLGLIGLMAASANGWLGTGKSAESAVSFVGYALVLARSAGGIASFYGNYQRGSVAAARLAELLRE
ncbi:MAG: ABC transporter ATP-binding protein, partial [Chromatiales bacterium]|nr:ABC transporter ATP-binding protein [Chromatiales bacterium]